MCGERELATAARDTTKHVCVHSSVFRNCVSATKNVIEAPSKLLIFHSDKNDDRAEKAYMRFIAYMRVMKTCQIF